MSVHIEFYEVDGGDGIKWHWRRVENGAAMHMSAPFDSEAKARQSAETDINGYKSYPEARYNGPLNPRLPEHEIPEGDNTSATPSHQEHVRGNEEAEGAHTPAGQGTEPEAPSAEQATAGETGSNPTAPVEGSEGAEGADTSSQA